MAYNEALTEKVRLALTGLKNLQEKKMFRGVTFMVNKKMFMTVGDNEVMVRVNPDDHDDTVKKYDGREMIMKGRVYRGYIYVDEKRLNARVLKTLVKQALAFNSLLKEKQP
jgi:TfoX/Sxy family transcriptional regulator of competence genes